MCCSASGEAACARANKGRPGEEDGVAKHGASERHLLYHISARGNEALYSFAVYFRHIKTFVGRLGHQMRELERSPSPHCFNNLPSRRDRWLIVFASPSLTSSSFPTTSAPKGLPKPVHSATNFPSGAKT